MGAEQKKIEQKKTEKKSEQKTVQKKTEQKAEQKKKKLIIIAVAVAVVALRGFHAYGNLHFVSIHGTFACIRSDIKGGGRFAG